MAHSQGIMYNLNDPVIAQQLGILGSSPVQSGSPQGGGNLENVPTPSPASSVGPAAVANPELAGPSTSHDSPEQPPPYSEIAKDGRPLPSAPPPWDGGAGQGVFQNALGGAVAPSLGGGAQIRYVDFMPKLLEQRNVVSRVFSDDTYESFEDLVKKANDWLKRRPDVAIKNCETVVWAKARNKEEIFSDSQIFTKTFMSGNRTKYTRGLRIWYSEMGGFHHSTAATSTLKLSYKDYLPQIGQDMQNALKKLNSDLPNLGQLINLETVQIHYKGSYSTSAVSPTVCFWREDPGAKKHYVLILRSYFLETQSPFVQYDNIDMMMFSPKYDQKTEENKGYEIFADMIERLRQWVIEKRCQVINIQSFYVKAKKGGGDPNNCFFTEHACAHGDFVKDTTYYFRVIRIYYGSQLLAGGAPYISRVSCKAFTPVQVATMNPAGQVMEQQVERLSQTVERINRWIQLCGAKVLCVETIPVRMYKGSQKTLGPEATFCWNSYDQSKDTATEKWIYNIRIYLDGDYHETLESDNLVRPNCVRLPLSSDESHMISSRYRRSFSSAPDLNAPAHLSLHHDMLNITS